MNRASPLVLDFLKGVHLRFIDDNHIISRS